MASIHCQDSEYFRSLGPSGLALGAFEPMPYALAKKPDGSLGTPELFADFPCAVAFETQFEHRAFIFIELSEELFDCFAQDGRFLRRGLAPGGFHPRRGVGCLGHFPRAVAPLSLMIGGPFSTFAN